LIGKVLGPSQKPIKSNVGGIRPRLDAQRTFAFLGSWLVLPGSDSRDRGPGLRGGAMKLTQLRLDGWSHHSCDMAVGVPDVRRAFQGP
jgi:hypothetical protein